MGKTMSTRKVELVIEAPTTLPTQNLHRSMKILGTLLITLSAVSPASSVFIIIPGIVQTAGSGAFLSMILAAVIGVCMSLVYAELASAFPLTGGEYAIVGRLVGPLAGFIVLGVNTLSSILIPAVFALGLSSYLTVLFPHLEAVPTAVVSVILATLISTLNIRSNAVITGTFLVIEVLALVLLVVFGLVHVNRPITDLIFHPIMLGTNGLVRTPVGLIGMGVTIAIFAYNGYGSAVYFGEEMHDATKKIGHAILMALGITVLCELAPLTAVLLGAPDLKSLFGSSNMFGDFIASRAGSTMNTFISLGIALAIFNAMIACILAAARMVFSTARDNVWPLGIDDLLVQTHPRFHSPHIATLLCGAFAVGACFVNETVLFVITGTGLVAIYAAICYAVMLGRKQRTTDHGHYRMPLFPLAPITAILMLFYVIYANWQDPVIGRPSLLTTLGVIIASAVYYLFVLRRKGAWVLRGPED
ncbi:APC family permease [Acidocella sp. KAb 2-4]|uniref:APC family permease n=1 Tax=Acidocella sp. KAb 2-4 TaxID=2885158 RepID=UPI001D08CD28|nr:APC family permease [Acidocella sp. KAb 2-4]MCB5946044.1 APC family permease [Acidocella sp. KAb 2-4]